MEIYTAHMDESSDEEINVDEETRLSVHRNLSLADSNLFDTAQKQVNITLYLITLLYLFMNMFLHRETYI